MDTQKDNGHVGNSHAGLGGMGPVVQPDAADGSGLLLGEGRKNAVDDLNLVRGRAGVEDGGAAEDGDFDLLFLADSGADVNVGIDRLADEHGAAAALGHEADDCRSN